MPKVLTTVKISALKVRVFGKKWQKPHANLTQKLKRTHDLTQVLDFHVARPGFEPGTSGLW